MFNSRFDGFWFGSVVMSKDLTAQQQSIVEFIRRERILRDCVPSARDIAAFVQFTSRGLPIPDDPKAINPNSATCHLDGLRKKGILTDCTLPNSGVAIKNARSLSIVGETYGELYHFRESVMAERAAIATEAAKLAAEQQAERDAAELAAAPKPKTRSKRK
jgi:hypothetical protein